MLSHMLYSAPWVIILGLAVASVISDIRKASKRSSKYSTIRDIPS